MTYHMLWTNTLGSQVCGEEYDREQLLMLSPTLYPVFPPGGL